jgi:hypothetical protein
MKVKLTIPETLEDITLGKFQELTKLDDTDVLGKISLVTGISKKDLQRVQKKDLNEIEALISDALTKEGEFKQRFEMQGVEFGMIPNFDKITAKEFMDLSGYGVEVETLHNVMAILYRPIKSKGIGDTYEIYDYQGTAEWADAMKQTPLSYVNGVLAFFLTLQKDLNYYFLKYTNQEQARGKVQTATFQNGGGMRHLMN